MLVNGIDADSSLAPYNAQHAAIMHGRQQMSGSVRQPAPVVPDCAVRKIVIYFARVCLTALSHKSQHKLRAFLARGRPFSRCFGRHTGVRARVHECLNCVCHESVHDEEVFLDRQLRVESFEVAGVVIFCAMTQHKILSARGRTDRIGLYKTHAMERGFQWDRLEKTTSNGIAP